MINEYVLTEYELKNIVKSWTDTKTHDPAADRGTLENIIALVCTDGDIGQANNLIDKWRKEKIDQIYDNEYEYEYE